MVCQVDFEEEGRLSVEFEDFYEAEEDVRAAGAARFGCWAAAVDFLGDFDFELFVCVVLEEEVRWPEFVYEVEAEGEGKLDGADPGFVDFV